MMKYIRKKSSTDCDDAFVVGGFEDIYTDGDAFGHLGYVGDDADFATLCAKLFERIHRYAKRVTVERTETLVDKERFYLHPV